MPLRGCKRLIFHGKRTAAYRLTESANLLYAMELHNSINIDWNL